MGSVMNEGLKGKSERQRDDRMCQRMCGGIDLRRVLKIDFNGTIVIASDSVTEETPRKYCAILKKTPDIV